MNCMHVTRMFGPDDRERQFVAQPTWEVVERAIRSLNGLDRTFVSLSNERPDSHMGIGGGSGYFICYVTDDNLNFNNLIDPSNGLEMCSLVTGGQRGEFQARQCVTLEAVLDAASAYYKTGRRDESLVWEPQ